MVWERAWAIEKKRDKKMHTKTKWWLICAQILWSKVTILCEWTSFLRIFMTLELNFCRIDIFWLMLQKFHHFLWPNLFVVISITFMSDLYVWVFSCFKWCSYYQKYQYIKCIESHKAYFFRKRREHNDSTIMFKLVNRKQIK